MKTNLFWNIHHHINLLQCANYSSQKISAQLCSGCLLSCLKTQLRLSCSHYRPDKNKEVSQGRFQPLRQIIPGRSCSLYSGFITLLSLATRSATLSLTPYQKTFTLTFLFCTFYMDLTSASV